MLLPMKTMYRGNRRSRHVAKRAAIPAPGRTVANRQSGEAAGACDRQTPSHLRAVTLSLTQEPWRSLSMMATDPGRHGSACRRRRAALRICGDSPLPLVNAGLLANARSRQGTFNARPQSASRILHRQSPIRPECGGGSQQAWQHIRTSVRTPHLGTLSPASVCCANGTTKHAPGRYYEQFAHPVTLATFVTQPPNGLERTRSELQVVSRMCQPPLILKRMRSNHLWAPRSIATQKSISVRIRSYSDV